MKLYPVAILLLCSACGQEREQSSATPTPVGTVYVTAPQASSVPSAEPLVEVTPTPTPMPSPSPTETPAPLASPTPTPTPSPLQTSFPANIALRLKANECGGGCGGYFELPAFTVDPNTFTADLTPPAAWGAPDSCVDRQESWHIVMDPNNIPNMTFTATWSGTCQMGIHTECTCIYYN